MCLWQIRVCRGWRELAEHCYMVERIVRMATDRWQHNLDWKYRHTKNIWSAMPEPTQAFRNWRKLCRDFRNEVEKPETDGTNQQRHHRLKRRRRRNWLRQWWREGNDSKAPAEPLAWRFVKTKKKLNIKARQMSYTRRCQIGRKAIHTHTHTPP
jgi:hypothetical protein